MLGPNLQIKAVENIREWTKKGIYILAKRMLVCMRLFVCTISLVVCLPMYMFVLTVLSLLAFCGSRAGALM